MPDRVTAEERARAWLDKSGLSPCDKWGTVESLRPQDYESLAASYSALEREVVERCLRKIDVIAGQQLIAEDDTRYGIVMEVRNAIRQSGGEG